MSTKTTKKQKEESTTTPTTITWSKSKKGIVVTILGNPTPQQRHRVRRMGRFITTYDPLQKHKEGLTTQLLKCGTPELLQNGIIAELAFNFPIPKSQARLVHPGDIHTKRPDVDNCIKFVFDLLNGIFYKDDSQIHTVTATKTYSDKPQTILTLLHD